MIRKAIKSIEFYYTGRCVLIAGQSFPLQHQHKEVAAKLKGYKINLLEKDPKKAQDKLNKYYKELGYSMIKKWDKYFFIKNLEPI